MAKLPIDENDASRERLARSVEAMSHTTVDGPADGDRALAQALARLAFRDRWACSCCVAGARAECRRPPCPTDITMPSTRPCPISGGRYRSMWQGGLAVDAAKAVDREITRVETPVDAALTASGPRRLLHQYRFRNDTLDILEQTQRQDAPWTPERID
jgi:hypothetical protein